MGKTDPIVGETVMTKWDDRTWDCVDDAVQRLEESWRSAPGVNLAELVPPPGDPRREKVLVTLIKIDQEHRWGAGDQRLLERYLGDWPELGSTPDVAGELLEAECRTRAAADDLPTLQELHTRFPDIYDQVDLEAIKAEAEREHPPCEQATASSCADGTANHASSENRESPTLPNGYRLGKYEIRAVLGRGGMATVYLAEDTELERPVAIKVPHRHLFRSGEEIHLFLTEAQTAAKLKHPAIVAVYDFGRDDEATCYVVMEYIDGKPLTELIESGGLSHAESAELLAQVAEALHFAHKQGFFHRDIKPANILVDSEGKPHIADFGLAVHESVQRLRAGERSGTLCYMPPEQVRGETHLLDGRADIWALGGVLYEILTGRRPFTGENLDELIEEIFHREPRPPRQIDDTIPHQLERVCLKCLSKQVTDRYTNAGDLARDLRRWQHPRRRLPVIFSAAALAAAALVMVAILWRPGPTPRLDGSVNAMVWNASDPSRRGLELHRHGVLPLQPQDQVRVEVHLNRPAYVYLLWVNTEGVVLPLYPWAPGDWTQRPPDIRTDYVSSPAATDQAWPIQGPAGMETLQLLVRETPLPRDVDLEELLDGLPAQRMVDPRAMVWFADGKVVDQHHYLRGPDLENPQELDDPLVEAQGMIEERVGRYFTVNRAVSFANAIDSPQDSATQEGHSHLPEAVR